MFSSDNQAIFLHKASPLCSSSSEHRKKKFYETETAGVGHRSSKNG